jgi:hypothetical protein
MEGWRLIAAALNLVSGVVIALLVMAKVRERKESTAGNVALAGAISLTVLALLTVLVITVLPAALVWISVALLGVTVSVMMLAS